jgi:hypothetical protein
MLDIPTYGNPPVPYALPVPYKVFEKTMPCISKAAYAFIEDMQPYHTGPGTHNVLRIIAELANIDKHKHLHVILPKVAVHHEVTYSDGVRDISTVGGLKHGAQVPLPDEISDNPPVNIRRSFSAYITFDETIGAGPDTLESQNVLEVCLDQIETVIIPTFDQLLHNP